MSILPRNRSWLAGETMSIRSRLISEIVRPFKHTARKVLGETLYQQLRVTCLGESNGLGLDWRWGRSLRRISPCDVTLDGEPVNPSIVTTRSRIFPSPLP